MARVSQQAADLATKTLNDSPIGIAEVWIIPTEHGFAYRASRIPSQIAGIHALPLAPNAPVKEVVF